MLAFFEGEFVQGHEENMGVTASLNRYRTWQVHTLMTYGRSYTSLVVLQRLSTHRRLDLRL